MNHHQHQKTAEEDVSGLMLLADVFIEAERMEMIFESFPKRQRTRYKPSSLKVDSLHDCLNGPLNSQSPQLEPSQKKKMVETIDVDEDQHKPLKSFSSNCLNGLLASQSQPESSRKRKIQFQANHDPDYDEYKPRQSFSNKKKEKNTEINAKQKKKKKNMQLRQDKMEEEPMPTPIPACFEELARTHLYNAQPAMWVCRKLLKKSDTDKGLRRIFMPTNGSENTLKPALTEQEKRRLLQGIPVLGLDQNGRSWNLELKYWPSIPVNILQREWIDLVNKNQLTAGDTVLMWLTRYSSPDQLPLEENKLCLLIGWERKLE